MGVAVSSRRVVDLKGIETRIVCKPKNAPVPKKSAQVPKNNTAHAP